MPKHTFKPATRDGRGEPITYKPIIYTRQSGAYRLALHRTGPRGAWKVSDPVSGYGVANITASHKGITISSKHLTQKQAQAAALIELDLLVDRIGFDRFDQTITAAQQPKD